MGKSIYLSIYLCFLIIDTYFLLKNGFNEFNLNIKKNIIWLKNFEKKNKKWLPDFFKLKEEDNKLFKILNFLIKNWKIKKIKKNFEKNTISF